MKSSLRSRLKWLESRTQLREPFKLIYGWLTHLPEDFVGERHTVIVKREPTGSPHAEWCQVGIPFTQLTPTGCVAG